MRFMHQTILGAGLWVPWLLCQAASVSLAPCPPAQAPVLEVFVGADCERCWAGADEQAAMGWRFDWIVPAGEQATMAAAALRDSLDRLARARLPAPGPLGQQLRLQPAARLAQAAALSVASGLPLSGYYALQLQLRSRPGQVLPAGSQGWLALVELLPAGSEGSASPRALVRSVAGPLPLTALGPGRPLNHLAALRWPEGALLERLQARAWIEAADGRILAVAADRCGP